MNNEYSNCLYKGIQEIIHIIAVPNIDDVEKKTVINVFSKALTESICNPSRISDCDFLIHTASMRHIDAKITSVYQKRQASAEEIESTLALCARQAANIQMFADKQWTLPAEIHVNLKDIESDLRKRLDSMSFSDKLAGLDRQIDELVDEVRNSPSVEKCNSILKLIDDLQSYLSEAQRKRYSLPEIHNRDVSKTISAVMAIRGIASTRDELYQKIIISDSKISEIEGNIHSSREQWLEIIQLCKKQQEQISECQQSKWAVPRIHYPAVEDVIEQYMLYLVMDDFDKKISNAQTEKGQDQSAFLSDCSSQDRNIQKCKMNGWRIPRLKTANPSEYVERANKERERREREIKEISDRATAIDERIDILYHSSKASPSIDSCNMIDTLIKELKDVFQTAIQKDIQLTDIKNVKKLNEASNLHVERETEFATLRKKAEQLEKLFIEYQENSKQIDKAESNPAITPELCDNIFHACQIQDELHDTILKNGWESSIILRRDIDAIRSRFRTYQKMFDHDCNISDQIRSISQNTTGEIDYEPVIKLLTEQEALVDQCKQNQWVLPKLVVSNPTTKRRDYQAEVNHQIQLKKEQKIQQEREEAAAAKKKRIKRKLIGSGIGVVAVICLVFTGILLSRRGKIAFPFSPDYAMGSDCEKIQEELKNLGFTDIKTVADNSGWDKDNTILEMSVDDSESFVKGKYYKPETKIIIRYSSKNRINMSSVLNDWSNSKYTEVQNKLKVAGFTNITLQNKDEFTKEKDRLVAGLTINDQDYYGEEWYVPLTTPIVIIYYTYKIKVNTDGKSFIGQDYLKVTESLEKLGFTNIQKQEVTDGWMKNNTVISLLVNNSTEFKADASYAPDTKIVINYSSGERIDVTELLKNYDTIEAKTLKESFGQKGFSDISIQDQTTNKKPKNKLVAEVLFNGKSFESGDCYLPKNTKIVIMRYLLELMPGRESDQYKGMNYQTVVDELKEKGFTNIHLLRADDLVTGWMAGDKTIESITINGKLSFNSSDKFTYSDRIDIVVHTFRFRDYEDITEKAS